MFRSCFPALEGRLTSFFIELIDNKYMADLFVIWQVLLLVFGFSKVADLKLHKSAIIVGIMWVIATGLSIIPVYMNKLF
jgi:hypothetical protein